MVVIPSETVIVMPRAPLILGLLLLVAGPAQAQSWLETQIEIERLSAIGNLDAASALGAELLETITAAEGETSEPLANAHMMLAGIESANGRHLAAEGHVLDAIDILESIHGTQSTSLIDPFVVLGAAYRAAGEFELSLSAFAEAKDIGRRAYGLLNLEQIEILDQMALTRLYMGEFDEAKQHQLEGITIVQRLHGEDSIEYLDAYYRYAEWLRQLRRHVDAERVYFTMHRMINRDFDDDPAQMVRLLRTQAMNQREAMLNPGFGGVAYAPIAGLSGTAPQDLERALKIVRKLDEPDPLLEARVLRDLGDWNVAFGRRDEIAEPYREAWRLLAEVEDGDELRREWFAEQTFIYAAPLYSRMVVDDPAAPYGRINLTFTIDGHGRTDDIEIVGAVPAGLVDDAAVRQIMSSRFRPHIVGGEIVESTGAYTWEFQYDPQRALRFSGNLPSFSP